MQNKNNRGRGETPQQHEHDEGCGGECVRVRPEPGQKGAGGMSLAGLCSLIVIGGGALIAVMLWPERRDFTPVPAHKAAPRVPAKPFVMEDEKTVFAGYAGSASCQGCHSLEYAKWKDSNHGLAERALRDDLDRAGFDPAKSFNHGTQTSEARIADGKYEMVALGFENKVVAHPIERVIGHDPLRQFLVAGTGGRLHAMEMCFDPRKTEWFNVYGDEDRRPGEWGHWTGRGMVWNQMCASCHNTRLRKNYEIETDSYRTTMAEMTVSCESCHGPKKEHVIWQTQYAGTGKKEVLIKPTRDQTIETCAPCHARRSELTGDFKPGDSFWDHYDPSIVDHTDIYHADGQVRDENYEFGSFFSSRMYHAGVRCQDCHDMHSMKPILPGNQLCMRCHTPGGYPNAPVIMPEAHSFHLAASTGNQCVNCHMPQTTYMQRHPRHDHGFTIPDPLLTKEHGIPNACNRCHTDKDTEWALAATEKWWGPKMERRTRQRGKIMANARAGRDEARDGLLGILGGDETPYWKASAVRMLERWVGEHGVSSAVIAQTEHAHPLVRANAVKTLEPLVAQHRNDAENALSPLLDDPSRIVRTTTAWALRDHLDLNSAAGKDLLHMLRLNSDQPSGQMQLGQFSAARGDLTRAVAHMEKAVEWDPGSPPFRHDLAMVHNMAGNRVRTLEELRAAIKLNPREAQYHYDLGLLLSETGDMDGTVAAMREAVKNDPSFGRAWYNLGLALDHQNKDGEALEAYLRGESAAPLDAAIPYARATMLAQQGKREEALAAAQKALGLRPDFTQARELVQMLTRR